MLPSAFCKYCEQEFFYHPSRIGQGTNRERRPRKRRVCDLCRTDEKRVRRIKKFGPQAADQAPLTLAEQGELDYRHYVGSFRIIDPHVHLNDMHWTVGCLGNMSADRECEHGRLLGDECPSPVPPPKAKWVQSWPHEHPCGCWNEIGEVA